MRTVLQVEALRKCDLIFVTPEGLRNGSVVGQLLIALCRAIDGEGGGAINALIIDECHKATEEGEGFREPWLKMFAFKKEWFHKAIMVGMTATLSRQVRGHA